MSEQRKPGDFTGLANDYSAHRPDYCPSVLDALCGLLGHQAGQQDFADVGAGTGIWTRMVSQRHFASVTAIEPNADMRAAGEADSRGSAIQWRSGSAENTGLADASCDWLSMASSFHWADYDRAMLEFRRVLRPGGWFTALWNPRLIEVSPLLMEIEQKLDTLRPNIRRVSSGRSGITETLTDRLCSTKGFAQITYIEGRHTIVMSRDRYIGAWRSVNDLRVQLGEEKFDQFMQFVEERIRHESAIHAVYLTRAWSAQRVG